MIVLAMAVCLAAGPHQAPYRLPGSSNIVRSESETAEDGAVSAHNRDTQLEVWPFSDPKNVAVVTVRQIVEGGQPVLLVSHLSLIHI